LTLPSSSTPPEVSGGDYSTPGSAPGAPGLALTARIEGLLFASAAPVSIEQLATVLGEQSRQIERALEGLAEECQRRGIRVQRHDSRVQLTTAPELAVDIERLLGLEATAHLTQAGLEALAIIAYQQPVTRPHIDAVRGVNSDSVLGTLLRHGLIDEAGRSDGPGRPILYVTTPEFLQHFGLASLADLPPLGLAPLEQPGEDSGPGEAAPVPEAGGDG
jgi:segregation and condensation protein B